MRFVFRSDPKLRLDDREFHAELTVYGTQTEIEHLKRNSHRGLSVIGEKAAPRQEVLEVAADLCEERGLEDVASWLRKMCRT